METAAATDAFKAGYTAHKQKHTTHRLQFFICTRNAAVLALHNN